jgi:phage shock protein E
MKKALIIIVVVLTIVGGFLLVRSPSEQSQQTAGVSTEITEFSVIEKDLQNGAVLLDVRTLEEFNIAHIEKATLLPLQSMETGQFPSVEMTSKIYVYCRSGNRSAEAEKLLNDQGYNNIVDLGAMNNVVALGAKTVKQNN